MIELRDGVAREDAVTASDKNCLVVAGAGTGKTEILVLKVLHLLFSGHASIEEIVALTFTEKAASEMRIRIKDELQAVLDGKAERAAEFMEKYGLTRERVFTIAASALNELMKTEVGTIHSFCAGLLRSYPIEARVAPDFEVDEGDFFDSFFEEEWEVWLGEELSLDSPNKGKWLEILAKLSLQEVKTFGRELGGFKIPIAQIRSLIDGDGKWASKVHLGKVAAELKDKVSHSRDPENELALQMRELSDVFDKVARGKLAPQELARFEKKGKAGRAGDWEDALSKKEAEDVTSAAVELAKSLARVDDELISALVSCLCPFVELIRRKTVEKGIISFDGLLLLARDLVKENLDVRESLKAKYKAILIDEYQDTDPFQTEIIMYLAEAPGGKANSLDEIILEPGKLFIVGDPKQSIYLFRGADIEAYSVTREILKRRKDDSAEFKLDSNFRSHGGIVETVNHIFKDRIIRENEPYQPPYESIVARRPGELPAHKVELVFVTGDVSSGDGKLRVDEIRTGEAQWITEWIQRSVGKERIFRKEEGSFELKEDYLRYSDIAILLRTLTHVDLYINALRSRGIRYLVEGEKFFYENQEILDIAHLLSTLDNPHNKLVLVGFLRSPFGGLIDDEIHKLHTLNLLDYRKGKDIPASFPRRRLIEETYSKLEKLASLARRIPLDEFLLTLFDESFISELVSSAYAGEQKVANLYKILRMAEELSVREGGISLKKFASILRKRIRERKEEGESPLADPTVDAVKIFTIHKAKGLEFPVVIVPNLSGWSEGERSSLVELTYDWRSGAIFVKAKRVMNSNFITVEEKYVKKRKEEEKRIFYVATTRARERLILLGGRRRMRAETMLGHLMSAAGIGEDQAPGKVEFENGGGIDFLTHVFREEEFSGRTEEKKEAWAPTVCFPPIFDFWRKREKEFQLVSKKEYFLTPSKLQDSDRIEEAFFKEPGEEGKSLELSKIIGTVCHRALQEHDFTKGGAALLENGTRALQFHEEDIPPGSRDEVGKEIMVILSTFSRSHSYKEIARSTILGREIPFVIPWNGSVMSGVIDIIYEGNGRVVVADYKTDKVTSETLPEKKKEYRVQKNVYVEAVKSVLKVEKPAFKLIFLRTG